MKRTGFLRKPAPPTLTVKVARPRRCKAPGCTKTFTSSSTMRTWCDPDCGAMLGLKILLRDNKLNAAKQERDAKAAKKAERAADKAKKESLKTRSDWIKEVQVVFNRYIRLRDAGKPCICCNRFGQTSGTVGGGDFDAGHYRSTGSAPHLRFNEDNCHSQLKQCNRYGGGRAVDYRLGLIAGIGLARVEALEADQARVKHSIDDLRALRDHYRAAGRELERKES